MRVLRRKEVVEKTGLAHITLYKLEKLNKFPRRIQLTPNAVGWIESEVDDWIAARPRSKFGNSTVKITRFPKAQK